MRGAGAGLGLHAVRVVAVGVAVGQAAGRGVGVAARPAQVGSPLAGVGVAAGAGARAPLHVAGVRGALRQAGGARPLRGALVRIRVLLLGAPRGHVAVHHHVVARRLQKPRTL